MRTSLGHDAAWGRSNDVGTQTGWELFIAAGASCFLPRGSGFQVRLAMGPVLFGNGGMLSHPHVWDMPSLFGTK